MYSDFDYFKGDPPELTNSGLQIPVIKNAKLFTRHCTSQGFLICISAQKKYEFLKRIFNIIKDYKYTKMCFEIAYKYNMGKLRSYLTTIGTSDFSHDNLLHDHNRMLEDEEVTKAVNDSVARFDEYTNTTSLSILLTIMAISGGGMIRLMCQHMQKYYTCKSLAELKALKLQNEEEKGEEEEEQPKLAEDSTKYEEIWDTTNPDVIEILKKRKKFKDTMAKYRLRVEKNLEMETATQSSQKSSKTDIKAKKFSRDTNKSRMSTKQSLNRKSNRDIDIIQRMPIGIVKKIFSYLDNKTMNKVKNVNEYWEFAVQSTKKDIKARKSFDRFINKLEMKIGPETSLKSYGIVHTPKSMLLHFENRLKREGTISKDILKALPPIDESHRTFKSLFTEMVTEIPDLYAVPTYNLHCFSKTKYTETTPPRVHNKPPCIRFDGDKRPVTPFTKLPPIGDNVETFSSWNFSDFATSFTTESGQGEEMNDDVDLIQLDKRRMSNRHSMGASSSIGVINSTHKSIEDVLRKISTKSTNLRNHKDSDNLSMLRMHDENDRDDNIDNNVK